MAETAVLTGNALTVKAWEQKLFRDTKKESYFSRFMSEGPNSIVQEKNNLVGKKGDVINFGIRMRLSGGGVTSGQTLEGNEESLTTYNFDLALEEYAHAVKDAGPLDRQRPVYDMDMEAKQALLDWGSEKIDELAFTAIQNSPTKIFYGGDATSVATLETADLITPAILSQVRTWAKTGGNRTQTPLRPVKIGGKNYFVFLGHPDVTYDLKQDSTYAQAHREARERGVDNPIFSGALGVWDGVIVHEHENIDIYTNGGAGANVPYATNVFMGAQALCWAWGARPKMVAETFDYGRKHGYSWQMMAATEKPVFNSKDYGSIGVYTARTQVSDA